MRLDQFDKLQVLVRELKEYLLQIKQANYRLINEKEKLKENLRKTEEIFFSLGR